MPTKKVVEELTESVDRAGADRVHEEVSKPAPSMPALKFTVTNNDTVKVSIDVAAFEDVDGIHRPQPIQRDLLSSQRDDLVKEIDELTKRLEDLQSQGIEGDRVLTIQTRVLALRSMQDLVAKLIDQPYRTYHAMFKRPSWADMNRVHAESYRDYGGGAQQFSSEAFQHARLKFLLKSWDLEEEDELGRAKPIPVHRFTDVSPDIIDAFLRAFDQMISLSKDDVKN